MKKYTLITLLLAACLLSACSSFDVFKGVSPAEENLLDRGLEAIDDQAYDQAIDIFTEAIQDEPENAEFYYLRGMSYYGRYELAYQADDPNADGYDFYRAITDFTKAIELDNFYAEAFNYRGIAYAGLDMTEHALADYNEAIELDPNLATTYYGRGYLYEMQGEVDLAIADYEQFLLLSSDDFWLAEAAKRLEALKGTSP
jgi:tetratricopeptide (TPR) repeat protein